MRILIGLLACLLVVSANADTLKTVQVGATDQSVTLRIIDSADGTPETAAAFNSSGIDLEYWRHGANAAVDITEATQTVNGAHSDGGFVAIGHGVYRLDLPDAAVASGATAVDVYGTITGMIVIGGTVQLVAYNPQDATRMGMSALPNAAADAAGGLPISDAGGLDLDALNTNVNDVETDTADMQPKLGTFTDFGSGTSTLAANLQDLADNGTATYDRSTDSQQAIRDRGDAAWTTGAGACPDDVVCTTVATAPTTTTFTATAAPNDDTQLDGWAVLFTDNGDADSYCLRDITSVLTGTITYASACPFTVAAGDTVAFLPAFLDSGVDVVSLNGDTTAAGNAEAFFDGTGYAGTGNTIPTVTNLTNLPTIPANWLTAAGTAADFGTEVGTATWATTTRLLTAGTNIALAKGTGVTGFNDLSAAQVNAEVDTALTDYDSPTDTEMDAAFLAYLEQGAKADAAIINCEVNTANFAGSTTTLACILTDRDAGAITAASGDLTGKELLILSGAQIYEGRFINSTTWDGANSELQLTLSRALPGTLADAVTAIIR